jgi:hypothetical protein
MTNIEQKIAEEGKVYPVKKKTVSKAFLEIAKYYGLKYREFSPLFYGMFKMPRRLDVQSAIERYLKLKSENKD